MVAGAAGLLGGRQHPGETGGLRVVHGVRDGVRRHAVPPEGPRRHALLEEAERRGEPAVELVPGLVELPPAVLGRVGEEVLGVVEQADVERLEAQALERPRQLVLEELRVDAVPALRLVVHHLGERAPGALALLGQGEVLALHVADLRDDDDLLARDAPPPDRVADDAPHQPLAAAVGVVRRGVDEVDAARERPLERAPVDRGLVVDAVAAEAETAHGEAGAAERPIGAAARRGPAIGVAPGSRRDSRHRARRAQRSVSSPVVLPRAGSGSRVAPSYPARTPVDGRILGQGRRAALPTDARRRAASQEDPDDGVARLPRAPPPRHPRARRARAPAGLHDRGLRDGPGVRHLRRARRQRHPGRGHARARRRGHPLHVPDGGALPRRATSRTSRPSTGFPVGGARLTPDNETRYLYGPPLAEPADRRGLGARTGVGDDLRPRATAGRALPDPRREAGRSSPAAVPAAGAEPVLRHPEGVAIDAAGDVYVTDREEGAIVRLDARGNVVNLRHASVLRPRILTMDEAGNLWVGATERRRRRSARAAARSRASRPDGRTQPVLQGPLPAGFSQSPGGALFVVQRRTGQLFALTPDGRRLDFATDPQRQLPPGASRSSPVTPETRKAGIAGDLFLVLVSRSLWLLNEVIRVSGPFDEWVRQEASRPAP